MQQINMKKKVLIVSLGYGGGCLYYANSIIQRLSSSFPYNLYVSSSSEDIPCGATRKLPMIRGIIGQLLFLILSPIVFVHTLVVSSIKYNKLVVFGPNNFDCLFLAVFGVLGRERYLVIHDGVMHQGEYDNKHQAIMNLAMRLASHHIYLTEYVAHRVKSRLNIVKPYYIIPHGPIIYGKPQPRNLGNVLKLLVIGRLSYYKGLHIICKIIPYLKTNKCELTIAGSMPSDIRHLFANNDCVNLIDHYLTEEEINRLVNDNDVLLMPYIEATQSGIAAMSIGYCRPSIITKVGGLPEQLSSNEAFYMGNISSDSLLEQILQIKNNNDLYYEKTKNLELKKNALNWESITEQFERIVLSGQEREIHAH